MLLKTRIWHLAIVSLVIAACPKPTPGPTPVPVNLADAVASPDAPVVVAGCAEACMHMRALGCSLGNTTPHGATCEDVCGNIVGSGLATWNLACIAAVKACSDVDTCPTITPSSSDQTVRSIKRAP